MSDNIEIMEALLTEEPMYDLENDSNNLTIDEVMNILDFPSCEIKDISESGINEELFNLNAIEPKHETITDLPRHMQHIGPETLESKLVPSHIRHGVLNMNINKMLDYAVKHPMEVMRGEDRASGPIKMVRGVDRPSNPMEVLRGVERLSHPMEVMREVDRPSDPMEVMRGMDRPSNPMEVMRGVDGLGHPMEVMRGIGSLRDPMKVIGLDRVRYEGRESSINQTRQACIKWEPVLQKNEFALLDHFKQESEDEKDSLFTKTLCSICTKPALKHSAYGGNACTSCRSFFRRSAQGNYHTVYHCKADKKCVMDQNSRRNCKYCRFHSCLKSGMKVTWVLSDEERKRRFGKIKNADLEVLKAKFVKNQFSPTSHTNVFISFTLEEQKVVESTHAKFQVPWLQNFLEYDREAATKLIKYTFGKKEIEKNTWRSLKESMHINFNRYIIPSFSELSALSSSDIGLIMNSNATNIVHLFQGCFCFQTEAKGNSSKPFASSMALEVKSMIANPDLVQSLDLVEILSDLDISEDKNDIRMVAYDELYPKHWAKNTSAEQRHRDIVTRITDWPRIGENTYNDYLISVMILILTLNVDFYPGAHRKNMENIQLKYIMLLQRYLRSQLEPEAANKKFLESMMLISDTREAWEICNGPLLDSCSLPIRPTESTGSGILSPSHID